MQAIQKQLNRWGARNAKRAVMVLSSFKFFWRSSRLRGMSVLPLFRSPDTGTIQQLAMLIIVSALFSWSSLQAAEPTVLFREDFTTLDRWMPFTFPKIRTHSTYTIEREGGRSYLRAESKASASAIVYTDVFDVTQYPMIRWRWKVGNLYEKADATTKKGDDFPIRIYIMFAYDPETAGRWEAITYGFARSLYGDYPPHSSLNYVWSSREHAGRIITNPYTDRAKDILLRKGPALVGTWQDEEVDILDDYQAAFGTKPPQKARIAVMNDSDNTGESSVSWVDYIEVLREAPGTRPRTR